MNVGMSENNYRDPGALARGQGIPRVVIIGPCYDTLLRRVSRSPELDVELHYTQSRHLDDMSEPGRRRKVPGQDGSTLIWVITQIGQLFSETLDLMLESGPDLAGPLDFLRSV